ADVIHRDLKPQNIMLGAFGEVLVLDWGVAKTRHSLEIGSNHRNSTAAGTPGYMAPEQIDGAADERVDVFGLGGILFFTLTRAHPGSDASSEWLDVPAALRAICERARAIDPAARYQSVAALAEDVASYLAALPVAAHREGL